MKYSIHKNYLMLEEKEPELAAHVDQMFTLISNYAQDHGIPATYNDTAELLVEAIATYVVESRKQEG